MGFNGHGATNYGKECGGVELHVALSNALTRLIYLR